jgi:flagellar motor component MotA
MGVQSSEIALDSVIEKIVGWSNIARKRVTGLEDIAGLSLTHLFIGLQLLIDGNEPEAIRNTLK